jgi:prephenate dehydratase
MMSRYVDCLQIGARNMQNFELLKAVGSLGMPVILKRGLAARIEEWLMAAEYLMAHGSDQIILCERGIRTFETYTRNSLDISSIPVVKKLSHLPIIVDPSHSTGIRDKVIPVALGAIAAGADGLIVEVHPNPDEALSDGAQSLFPAQFEKLSSDIQALCPVLGKELNRAPVFAGGLGRDLATWDSEESEQLQLRVAFQGERGAYSEMALGRFFGFEEAEPVPCRHFEDVFEAVLQGRVQRGLLPIENALTGSIHENYDLLLQYRDIKIIGETKIRIQHSLIGLPDAEISTITRVYSHPQGLLQCERYLNTQPEWQRIPFYDTAGSVAMVVEQGDSTSAAIANSLAAKIYGAKVLKEGIETNSVNYTRFVVISRREVQDVELPTKASIVFSTPDRPGALLEAMQILSARQLNLQKIESRPIHGKPWTYMFYLDLSIPKLPSVLEEAFKELAEHTEDLRVLGRYIQAE